MIFIYKITEVKFCISLRKYGDVTLAATEASAYHTGIFKGCGYSSRLWLQFLKDVATGKNGRFAREFSGKSTTNAHFTEIMLSMPI